MIGNTHTTATRSVKLLRMVLSNFTFSTYHDWISAKSRWEDHFQAHLDYLETISTYYNPLVYGRVLATARYCGFCLNNISLPAVELIEQFPFDTERKNVSECFDKHVRGWNGQLLHFHYSPLSPQCKRVFDSQLRLQFHLQDVLYIVEGMKLKRLRQDDKMDDNAVQVKRQRPSYK
jgi:hypothetical protein